MATAFALTIGAVPLTMSMDSLLIIVWICGLVFFLRGWSDFVNAFFTGFVLTIHLPVVLCVRICVVCVRVRGHIKYDYEEFFHVKSHIYRSDISIPISVIPHHET